MNKNPLVSVVIPTYNRKMMAERLIRSLLKNSYRNIEIIVVDDASKDEAFLYLNSKFKRYKNVKIFRNQKNLFAAGSKNVGQEKAKGELVMFIDDDNVADPRLIEQLVKLFLKDSSVGEAGPINYNFNEKSKVLLSRSTRNMWTTKTSHLRNFEPFRLKKYWETDDIPNAFMVRNDIVRKNDIEFRTKFGIMYEESDYAYRIRSAGYKIVMVKGAKIFHDIENKGIIKKDYLYHFMEDKRRPFVFARNRIIFHSLYSTKLQNLFILSFWIWFFAAYYIYKFLFYKGYGDFPLTKRVNSALSYIQGTLDGLRYALLGSYKI